jgi:hypothetical protein
LSKKINPLPGKGVKYVDDRDSLSSNFKLSKGNTMKSVLAIVASLFALSAVAQTAPAKKEEAKPAAAAPAKADAKKDAKK